MYNFLFLVVYAVAHILLYRMFGKYALKMHLHHLCLKDFKESPTSKRVMENLPPMDIIRETDYDEEDENESSPSEDEP